MFLETRLEMGSGRRKKIGRRSDWRQIEWEMGSCSQGC
jgi:hypothetical protein